MSLKLNGFLLLLFTVTLGHVLYSQEEIYPFELWNKKNQLGRANTFDHVTYMNESEKEVLLYCNLVRINPKLFAQTYLQKYIDSSHYERSNSYVSSLFADLTQRKKGTPLYPDENLYNMAYDHAKNMGDLGKTGHAAYTKRTKTFLGDDYFPVGENCSYGFSDAMEIFMQLMIDEDTPGSGHRYNILDRNFNVIGISIQPHKTYDWNCVMEMGYIPVSED